jgi:hypothetical protein
MRGLVIFYIDVGTAPPSKAMAMIDDMKKMYKDFIDKLKSNDYEPIFIPIRPNSNTRVDFIPLQEVEDWKRGNHYD